MAAMETVEGLQPTINLLNENLFELRCLLRAGEIRYSAHCEIGRKQLLAFTTGNADLVLHYQRDVNCAPIIKRVPWFQGFHKRISALCFDPSGTWLLTASIDGSLYIVPALALVDENLSIDHRWATNDITSFSSLNTQSSYARPSALAWWQGVVESSHVGIIGTEHGEIVLVNLESGRQVGLTNVKGNVSSLHICQDNSLDVVSLLITSQIHQQWRLILEQRTNGYVFPLDSGKSFHRSNPLLYSTGALNDEAKNFPTTRSRLQGLKQLSVEKLAILKQKLAETRSRSLTGPSDRRDSSSSGGTDDTIIVGLSRHTSERRVDSLNPELVPRDMFLTPQYTRQGQHLFTGYHSLTNHLTIHETDASVVPLYVHKMPPFCHDILLTQRLFYVTDVHQKSLSIISCPLSETRIGGDTEFNSEAVIGRFSFTKNNEVIDKVYRVTDFIVPQSKDATGNVESYHGLPKKVEDLKLDIPLVDTCIIVTNFAAYKVMIRRPLLSVFMDLVLKYKELEKAERLALVFGLNLQHLLENAGDILLSNKEFPQAIVLYKLSRCRLLKSVLKFASAGHTSELLSYVTACLTPPSVTELSIATRIHLSNLSVMAFTELTLRASTQQFNQVHKQFSNFLSSNTFYDEVLAVNVAGQTGLWEVLQQLATQRGLYAQVLDVLMKVVRSLNTNSSQLSPHQLDSGLLMCLSESGLIQAMLVFPNLAKHHSAFVLANLPRLQLFALQRLTALYDPTNPVLRPLLIRCRARHRTTSHSSQSSQFDSLDLSETADETGTPVEEIVETFLLILLTLIHKRTPNLNYEPELMQRIQVPNTEKDFEEINSNADFKRRALSAGLSHVALIRNNNVYTWGNALQGCLGTGPTMSRYGSPQVLPTFQNFNVEVLSVSCGQCHSLAVTNNGIYAWGASQYGQLGLGQKLQCPTPELIICLAQEIIVDAVAGQYHSVALTKDGRVFTWGWGVHGQLGHGNTNQRSIPTLVTFLLGTIVRQISAGHAHTLVLTAEGDVYSFGSNVFGQLGNGTNIKSSLPVKVILLPEKVALITTGYFHSLAVTVTNKLYTWGASPQVLRLQAQAQKKARVLQQQIALEKITKDSESTDKYDEIAQDNNTTVQFEKKDAQVDDIQSTNSVSNNGPLHARQTTTNVKLPKSPSFRGINVGMIEEAQTHLQPSLVDTSLVHGQIIQISTGCHHSSLLTKDGSVYTWGRNLDGQIGNGSRREVTIPTPLSYNPASSLAKVPPRNNGYRSNEKRYSLGTDNETIKGGENQSDGKSGYVLTNGNEDIKRDGSNRAIKAVSLCCGCDYTVAMQPGGTVLAWGSNNMAQLGRPPVEDTRGVEGKLVLLKSSRRVVRLPHAAHSALDTPSQVPNIPTPVISYRSYDVTPLAGLVEPLSVVEKSLGETTLHYILERLNGLYDSAKILDKCIQLGNYQAASKICLLERNFTDALAYQFKILNTSQLQLHKFSHTCDQNLPQTEFVGHLNDNSDKTENLKTFVAQAKQIKENTELFDKHMEQNLVDTLEESEEKNRLKMSASRSLDSFQSLEQELHTFDCQGGSEELCEDSKSEDISLDITEDTLDNVDDGQGRNNFIENDCVIVKNGDQVVENVLPNSVPEMNEELDSDVKNFNYSTDMHCPSISNNVYSSAQQKLDFANRNELDGDVKGNQENAVVSEATSIVEFYVSEIEDESHAMMREVLQIAIEFWIEHNLPIENLENILLQHMSKFFYPLGLLLFCQQNKDEKNDENQEHIETNSLAMMNSLSTKFCLQVCSTLLRHIDQGRPTPEYIELLAQLSAKHYGPPITGYPGSNGNRTPEQMLDGVISTISSEECDSRPFIHIKARNDNAPDDVSSLLATEEDMMIFTCGHHFPLSTYLSEILPRMEAELLMMKTSPLPNTVQLLSDLLHQPGKVQTVCPVCIPPALENVVKIIPKG
ncbi:uncharacterized protein LOC105691366 isoform X1 [Athalia rosae]|uniref:uncharacterized protein LOC105691366 isoform X1 n=1 Tax=Athalia rosae TaxID=37344 RepID=UPI002033533C|nr:uncharacterized protein LOC105691366 isoform X1 [Athalia rosae]XP_012265196.2 uncharacterized protein LOC105691366 isoform X1 [Athalia rosae]XP_012265198.2 uncharacterized protein LOC105691366 isoform X1 [Athalia rosae]XP_012265199.2 uncharacterized protein LOC105691366 isoform X1 [Athalia rosae]